MNSPRRQWSGSCIAVALALAKTSLCHLQDHHGEMLNDRFQPNAVACINEMPASMLPVDPQVLPTALELADRSRRQPANAYLSRQSAR